jgi:hypothetical protein
MATIKTSTGIRHTADRGFYSGDIAESGILPQPVGAKRGRGRPRKDVGESGAKYDFSAFMSKVKVPEFKGTSRVYAKMEK